VLAPLNATARVTEESLSISSLASAAREQIGVDLGKRMERATGVEPATSSLGSWHSTAELRPLCWRV
jgi:hypothetical protein